MTVYEFPKRLEKIRLFLPKIVTLLEEGQDWYAFVFLEDLEKKELRCSVTNSASIIKDQGVVMRVLTQHRNFEFATNRLEEDALLEKAIEFKKETLRSITQTAINFPEYKPLSWEEENIEKLDSLIREQFPKELKARTKVHFGTPFKESFLQSDLSCMSKKAKQIKTYLDNKIEKSHITLTGVFLQQKVKTKIFIDREKNISQSLLTSLCYAYAVSTKGKRSYAIRGGMAGFEAATLSLDELDTLVTMPQKMNEAEHLMPGRYKIITGPDVTGVIAHEAFGHTQEGDTCRYNRSCAPLLKKKDICVGNSHATIMNNAALFSMGKLSYGQNGSHFFDDEGQMARPQVILDNGYLQDPMNDLLSSIKGNINGFSPRQSNGKRESWRRPIMARQTNTYFTSGDKTLKDLIAMVDYGFLAEQAHGGMEDPKGMGLTAGTEYLKEIKDGVLTGKIFLGPQGGHIELSDPVPTLLKGIVAKSKTDDDVTSKDLVPYNKWGGCGKYHKELVEASCGGPWILWEGINCG